MTREGPAMQEIDKVDTYFIFIYHQYNLSSSYLLRTIRHTLGIQVVQIHSSTNQQPAITVYKYEYRHGDPRCSIIPRAAIINHEVL